MPHIVFVAPGTGDQRPFLRGLERVGAQVTGIGQHRPEQLDGELRYLLDDYVQVPDLADEDALAAAVAQVQARGPWVDRLECTVEEHVVATARVRERASIPGVPAETVALTRDKPRLKRFLAELGVTGAAGVEPALPGGGIDLDTARAFARSVGYPVVVKPRHGGDISRVHRIDDDDQLLAALGGSSGPGDLILEKCAEGHEGFVDGLVVGGALALEAVTHFYPSVLQAMKRREVSPIAVHTNRLAQDGYDELRGLDRRVLGALGLTSPETVSATHLGWFTGREGLWFSGLGLHPPPCSFWDLYSEAAQIDMYTEWARALCFGSVQVDGGTRRAAGLVNLRPDRDGVITHYDGVERMQRRYGSWIFRMHLPAPGTLTQPIGTGYLANAYVAVAHPDYDALREILADIGDTVRVYARAL
jgi:hypothetical protein